MKRLNEKIESFKIPVTEEQLKEIKDKRNKMYKEIVKADLGLGIQFINLVEDENVKISFVEQAYKCATCYDSDECSQFSKFMQPHLEQYEEDFVITYQPCINKRGGSETYINTRNCNNYFHTKERDKILNHMLLGQGIYLHGLGGRGKTFTLGYVENYFNKKGKSTYFKLANTIQKNVMDYKTKNEELNKIYNADMIFIDDFGGNDFTEKSLYHCWIPIIKELVDNNKPIFIASNYALKSISKEIEVTLDKTTADIICDRLKQYGEFEFNGENYRTTER